MLSYNLTNQKIPDSKKTKDWHVQHIKEFVNIDVKMPTNERKEQQLKCWKAYAGITNKEGEQANSTSAITKPYGFSLGMEWILYPLVESKLEQMVGEFISRGIKRKTYVLNKSAQSKKLNELFNMLSEDILRNVNKELEPSLGFVPDTESPDKELPPDIEEFFESGFKTVSEQVSDTILNQVLYGKKQIDKIKELFLSMLLFDEVIAEISEEDSQPSIVPCNIFETITDFDPNKEIQNDPQYVIKNKYLSYNNIINSFDLNKEEEEILKSYIAISSSMNGVTTNSDGYDTNTNYSHWITKQNDLLQIRCVEMFWISQKKIRVKVSINAKNGKEIYKSIPENYKERKTDNIKSIWVQQKRFCTMVGPDLVLEYGEDNDRFSRIDDPKKDSLSFVALRRGNTLQGQEVRSAAAKLLQLQEFASECLFELRLTMRRNNGRVLVYDAAQVPKQFLKTGGYQNAINRVMHHAKKDQFLIINSMDKQSRAPFNQFTSLDMSSRGAMQDLFNTLALIEDLASKFVGISPQQQGVVNEYESATGTERAVAQGTVRQQVYIKPFESFLKFLFDKVLIKGKYCYEENEVAQYIFGDLKTKFFKIYPEYFQEDVGVYIGDGYAEEKKKNIIDQAAQQTLAAAQTPDLILNLIEVLNADTAGESEAILKRGIKALETLRKEQQDFEAENAKTQAEATDRQTAQMAEDKRLDRENEITVAKIYADNKSVTESVKMTGQQKMKLADIEKDLLLAQQKNSKS